MATIKSPAMVSAWACGTKHSSTNVPVVLKLSRAGEHHRVAVDNDLDYHTFNRLIQDMWEGEGAQLARYLDEDGDECMITAATFSDFLHTAAELHDGRTVLKVKLVTLFKASCEPTVERPQDLPLPTTSAAYISQLQSVSNPHIENLSSASSQGESWENLEEDAEDNLSEVLDDAPSDDGSWQHVEEKESDDMSVSDFVEEDGMRVMQNDAQESTGSTLPTLSTAEVSEETEDSDHTASRSKATEPDVGSDVSNSSSQQESNVPGTGNESAVLGARQEAPTPTPKSFLMKSISLPLDIPQTFSRRQVHRQLRHPVTRGSLNAMRKFCDKPSYVHMDHVCDGCEMTPILGPRFTCKDCPDYDLCSNCHVRRHQVHNPAHRFRCVSSGEGVVRACLGGCGYGVTSHSTHCCIRCSQFPGQHGPLCSENIYEAS